MTDEIKTEKPFTSIGVTPKTLDRLNEIGKMGQTKDELINQLIEFWFRYKHVIET